MTLNQFAFFYCYRSRISINKQNQIVGGLYAFFGKLLSSISIFQMNHYNDTVMDCEALVNRDNVSVQ